MTSNLLPLIALAALAAGAVQAQKVKLTASPAVIASDGDAVTVTWSGVSNPHPLDFIGFQWNDEQPLALVGLYNVTSSSTWQSGNGQFSVPMRNLRLASYRWGYHSYLADGDVVTEGWSNTVRFASRWEPTGVHLSLAGEEGAMRVMWVSGPAKQPQVQWGYAAHDLYAKAAASQATYNRSQMCGAPANLSQLWIDPGSQMDAVMSNLTAGRTVFYRVGAEETGWSAVLSFIMPQPAGSDGVTTHLLAFGDMGVKVPFVSLTEQQPPAENIMRWLVRDLSQWADGSLAVLNFGDLSYARGWAFLWDEYLAAIQPVASAAAWMTCPGNHEIDWPTQPWQPQGSGLGGQDSGGECGVPYTARFHMPEPPKSKRNMWYSFEYGLATVVAFSTEADYSNTSVQYAFMENAMANVNRSKTPWLIVMGHRPMYSSSGGHDIGEESNLGAQNEFMREILEPMMLKHGVDLVLWGHVHAYERTCGIANYTCAAKDSSQPVHLTVGSAGNVYQPDWQFALRDTAPVYGASSGHHNQPDWSVYRSMNFGYSRITLTQKTLTAEFIGAQRGEVHDSVTLSK